MLDLVPIFLISLTLALFSQVFSIYDDKLGSYAKREHLFFAIMIIVMSVFIGLRTRYNDTGAYRWAYHYYLEARPESFSAIFNKVDWTIGNNPGFNLVNQILAYYKVSEQSFLMIYSIITNSLLLWFIGKYSSNRFFSVFLYIMIGSYVFTAAAIKQCVAMAILALATDRAINKKYAKFVFWVLIAITFHAYSFMYLMIFFLDFEPWSKKTRRMLGIFAVIGVSLQFLVGTLINVTSMMGEEYTVELMSGEGVNIFRVIVAIVPIILSYIVRDEIAHDEISRDYFSNRANNIMLNLTMLQGALMFVGLFGTANYFGRLANYFELFACITVPWLLKYLKKDYRTIITFVAYIMYFLFFYYGHVIQYKFDDGFDRITLKEYFDIIKESEFI